MMWVREGECDNDEVRDIMSWDRLETTAVVACSSSSLSSSITATSHVHAATIPAAHFHLTTVRRHGFRAVLLGTFWHRHWHRLTVCMCRRVRRWHVCVRECACVFHGREWFVVRCSRSCSSRSSSSKKNVGAKVKKRMQSGGVSGKTHTSTSSSSSSSRQSR